MPWSAESLAVEPLAVLPLVEPDDGPVVPDIEPLPVEPDTLPPLPVPDRGDAAGL